MSRVIYVASCVLRISRCATTSTYTTINYTKGHRPESYPSITLLVTNTSSLRWIYCLQTQLIRRLTSCNTSSHLHVLRLRISTFPMPKWNSKRKSKRDNSRALQAEPRSFPYRRLYTWDIAVRMERAQTQNFSLLQSKRIGPTARDYHVAGSTGTQYCVRLCHTPTCSCPDFVQRQDLCKHILFVTVCVVGLAIDDPRVFQRGLTTSELVAMFNLADARTRSTGNATGLDNALQSSPNT
jgi:hypothetical protein